MFDNDTPDLGAEYTTDDAATETPAAADTEVDNTALADGDDAQVETVADADSDADTTEAEAAE